MSLINVNLQAFLLNCMTTTTGFQTFISTSHPTSFVELSPFIYNDVNYISLDDYNVNNDSVLMRGISYDFTKYKSNNGLTYLVCEVRGLVVPLVTGLKSFYIKFSDTSFVGISGAFKIIALKHNNILGTASYVSSTYASSEKRLNFNENFVSTYANIPFNFRFVAVV